MSDYLLLAGLSLGAWLLILHIHSLWSVGQVLWRFSQTKVYRDHAQVRMSDIRPRHVLGLTKVFYLHMLGSLVARDRNVLVWLVINMYSRLGAVLVATGKLTEDLEEVVFKELQKALVEVIGKSPSQYDSSS